MRCKQSGNDLLLKLFPQGKLAIDIDKHLPVPTYQTSLSELECVIKYELTLPNCFHTFTYLHNNTILIFINPCCLL